MPHSIVIARTVAAGGLVLAALGLELPAASPAAATAEVVDRCTSEEVTVVVDFNELGGPTSLACAKGPASAADLFEAAGFPLTYTRAPAMQGFVCSVAGKPGKGPCTDGDSYWSLWWSAPASSGQEPRWGYATLGAGQLEVDPGGYVGFAWHEGDVDAAPPDVGIPVGQGTEDAAGEQVTTDAPEQPEADDGGIPAWVLLGAAAVVLGAAGVVPLLRRRRSG